MTDSTKAPGKHRPEAVNEVVGVGPRQAPFPLISRMGYAPALDGIRGIAVALVLLYHGRVVGFLNGGIGVEIFFVLSGFLITTLLLEEISKTGRISFKDFYIRRAARLLPAYFAVVAVCLVVEAIFRWGGTNRGILTSFVYMANWSHVIDPAAGLGMLNHTWTLSIEEQFYFVWPLTLLLLCRWTKSLRKLAVVITGLIAVFAFEIAVFLLSGAEEYMVRVVNGTDTRAPMLLSGALLACLLAQRRRGAAVRPHVGIALQLGAAVGLVALFWVSASKEDSFVREVLVQWPIIVLASCLLIVVAVGEKTVLARLLSVPPLVWLGKISYGLYLWHFPIFFAVDRLIGLDALGVIIATTASLLVSVASYHFLEYPIRHRAQAYLRRRREPVRS